MGDAGAIVANDRGGTCFERPALKAARAVVMDTPGEPAGRLRMPMGQAPAPQAAS
jgi:hypothetical protein